MTELNERLFANRQQMINLFAGIIVFIVNLCISFFLTPYIVKQLGSVAYGFIGLSNNILSYAGLLTIAINSMAGRFVAIEVHCNNIAKANTYLSSVICANIVFSAIIMSGVFISGIFLEKLIHIPADLVHDVKMLYIMLGASTCLSLFTGVFGIATFITNRLDINHLRNIIGNLIRGIFLFLLFTIFQPQIWYFGLCSLLMSIYLLVANITLYHRLTPYLKIRQKFCKLKALLNIAASGIWNIINKISNILTRGCELLLANLYVSSTSMGLLSIATTLGMLVLSFFGMIAGNFAPALTRLYSVGNQSALKNEILKSIRLCGFLCSFPIAILYAFGDLFFALWVPGQNTELLYILSIVGTLELLFGMPIEPLWNIFIITSKVKGSSLYQLFNSIITFITIIGLMYVTTDDSVKIIIVAGIHSVYCVIRNLTFLPIYGARCLNFKNSTFYPDLFRAILNTILVIAFGFSLKILFFNRWFIFSTPKVEDLTWASLLLMATITFIGAILISNIILLNPSDRIIILDKIKNKLSRK